ncbi:MAG: cation:proton antiporter [Rhodospirillaceae bacterium]|nr:cation:proton antiporter [Rhodospirillaceae bacterium]|tara:strand:- start:1386 stop:1964 length:579 start_codon:yes stop_codon:yes gene_type:complete
MEFFINLVLLLLLLSVTIGMVVTKDLFSLVVLGGVYSFFMATLLIVMDAVDVGMTEAAVGAGMSTVLLLSALYLTNAEATGSKKPKVIPLAVTFCAGGLLVYGTLGLPLYGASDTPINNYVGQEYISRSVPETTVPNVVTSVLSSYRGYDTLGETTVIFTAGIGVLMLLKGRRRKTVQTTNSRTKKIGDIKE